MDEADRLSSELLSDREVFVAICSWIREATVSLAVNDKVVRNYKNNICILPLNELGITRRRSPYCIPKSKANITYNPDDLTILGGSALNLYDFKLEPYKQKKGFEHLVFYTSKATPDIDIVWWPRVSFPPDFTEDLKESDFPDKKDVAITSSSPAIIAFVKILIIYLYNTLNKNLFQNNDITRKIKSIIGRNIKIIVGKTDEPRIDISKITDQSGIVDMHIYMAGVWSIPIYLVEIEDKPNNNGKYIIKTDGIKIKLADLTIHDSASGQRSNKLDAMITDPVYSITSKDIITTTLTEDSKKFTIPVNTRLLEFDIQKGRNIKEKIKIAVPNIKQFLWQQFFAIQKRLYYDPAKVLIHHKRISYMYNLLKSYNSTNSDIFNTIIGVDSVAERDDLIKYIRSLIFESKEWIYSCPSNVNNCFKNVRVLEFCKSEKDKMLVSEICDKKFAEYTEQQEKERQFEEQRRFVESPEQIALRAEKRRGQRRNTRKNTSTQYPRHTPLLNTPPNVHQYLQQDPQYYSQQQYYQQYPQQYPQQYYQQYPQQYPNAYTQQYYQQYYQQYPQHYQYPQAYSSMQTYPTTRIPPEAYYVYPKRGGKTRKLKST